jgi:hypothetical protein
MRFYWEVAELVGSPEVRMYGYLTPPRAKMESHETGRERGEFGLRAH